MYFNTDKVSLDNKMKEFGMIRQWIKLTEILRMKHSTQDITKFN